MNESEKVAALEALLARVQRNAAQPRAAQSPARAELAPQPLDVARAAEPLPESLDDWSISSVAPPVRPVAKPPPAPTAPYPVFREPVAAAPTPPPAAPPPEAAPPPTARSAYHQDAPPPSWPDLAPPSYPTMPGIAGPPQPRPGLSRPVVAPAPKGLTDAQAAARVPAGAQPRPPAPGVGAPKPPAAAPPAAAGSPKPPAATPTPPTAPAEQTTGGAPAQAGPDRRAIVRTLPGVGAEQAAGPGEKPPEAVAAAAPPAKPAAATPATTAATPATTAPKAPPALPTTPAPRTPAAAPPKAPATPAAKPPAPPNPTPPPLPALKVPTSPTPALPGAAGRPPAVPVGGAPARTTTPPGGIGAPSPGGAAANPPAAPPPAAPPIAAPPIAAPPIAAPPIAAPPPARPPALQAVAKLSDVEAPPKVDIAEVEVSPDILALDRANSLPSIVDENTSDTFPGLDEAPTAKPRVVELSKLPPVNMPDEHDDEDDDEENAEEPTLLRPSPLEEQEPMEESLSEEPTLLRPSPLEKDAPLSSSEEPTLLRRSPLEQQEEDEAQAARAEGTKPSEEATDRKLRLNLPPEVIAQAEAELAASARTSPKAVGPRPVPVREAGPEEVPLNLGRRSKPRSAAFWGLALAAIASVAALIVVAIATDWPSRLRGPAQTTTAPTITAAPTTPEPPITAMPTATAIAATDAGSPPEDAGTDNAAVTPALTADAGADAGTDAGAPADAGTAATTPTTAPPATAPAGSPPGDPMSLPEKKGYLVVTTPTPVHVYVQGAQAGLANESLVVDCGPKFIRLGTPPAATPPPGGGAGAVKWRSEGRSVVITCRGVTSVTMTPTP